MYQNKNIRLRKMIIRSEEIDMKDKIIELLGELSDEELEKINCIITGIIMSHDLNQKQSS
jgi:hypothetical protein